MPIKAENRCRYPAEWAQIRARIQARAGNRCEECGVENYALGGRTKDGAWLPAIPEESMLNLVWPKPGTWSACGKDGRYERLRIVRIVCTTAHLDHQPEHCSDDNLRFLCQRCHLRYDALHHAQTAYRTRREGLADGDLFERPAPQREGSHNG